MEPKKISSFAKILRNNGDKVLNSDFKLSLSGFFLGTLNDSFEIIVDHKDLSSRTFQVVKSNNSKSEAINDLQFIYDFIQKTIVLSLNKFTTDPIFQGPIDISKFLNLKKLEVQRISIKQITGIKQIRSQLEELICVRKCLNSVQDVISYCGGDDSNGFVWNELKSADFSFNCLTTIDCSLEFAPWLQNLNLSHNQLISVDALKWLPNLKCLNLSFNKLNYIPLFNMQSSKRLKVLNLSNNFIETLSGLSRLEVLEELDLSGNCILDESSLRPLNNLIELKYLNLIDNPLSCYAKHRELVVRYLNKNTVMFKFLLNNELTSKYEKSITGTQVFYNTPNDTKMSSSSYYLKTPSINRTLNNTPSSSVSSINNISAMDTYNSHDLSEASTIDMNNSIITQQKRIKKRHATIADNFDEIVNLKNETAVTKSGFEEKEENKDHLKTKKEIENLRKTFGDNWLQSKTSVENVIGLPSQSNENLYSAEEMLKTFLNLEDTAKLSPIIVESKTVPSQSKEVSQVVEDSKDTTEKPAEIVIPLQNESILNDIYKEESISDPEDDEVSYIVAIESTKLEIFLIISDTNIKEKDFLTGRTITKWSLKMLESCERVKSNVLRIHFDTIKKDKKERNYELEKSVCQKLENYLRDILSQRPLSEMNQMLFRCATCTTQFSREITYIKQNKVVHCPNCNSTYVVEIKDQEKRTEINTKEDIITKSPSHSSIGSAGSLRTSSCSKISNSEGSLDSNQNAEKDKESMFISNAKESDIEILSNPSQSSIEVLDSLHSSRKHSEERRISLKSSFEISDISIPAISVNMGLKTLDEDTIKSTLMAAHLTESSSSGSITDSICTAYEQGNTTKATNKEIDNQTTNDNSVISSMLGGIFQSTNFLLSKSSSKSVKNYPEDNNSKFEPFLFNYIDFSNVDHRLKLFLYQNTFEDGNEHLKWLVRSQINSKGLPSHTGECFYDGLCVMSTTKFYIFQLLDLESDDPSIWLKNLLTVRIDKLESVKVLPWKIGVDFSILGTGHIYIILQDILRTDALLLLFADNSLPDSCSLDYSVSENLTDKIAKLGGSSKIKMLCVLNECDIILDGNSLTLKKHLCVVTDTNIILVKHFNWITGDLNDEINSENSQVMINLVEVEELNSKSFSLNFLDEIEEKCELWKLTFETDTSMRSTLNSIAECWEKLFGVPLLSV